MASSRQILQAEKTDLPVAYHYLNLNSHFQIWSEYVFKRVTLAVSSYFHKELEKSFWMRA